MISESINLVESDSSPKKPELKLVNSFSLNIIQDKSQLIPSNDSQLRIIQNLVEEIKKNGHKYSLISCLFLQFYKAKKDTLTKDELYKLLEEEIKQNKNRIISSHTGRCCMIDLKNYRRKAKDILKKKKWFSKRLNGKGEVEYKMNNKIVGPVLPRIISQLKSIEKNKDDFEDITIETYDNNEKWDNKSDIQIIKIREDDEENEYDIKYLTPPSTELKNETNITEEDLNKEKEMPLLNKDILESKINIETMPVMTNEPNILMNNGQGEMQQIEINLEKNDEKPKEVLNYQENNSQNKTALFNSSFLKRKRSNRRSSSKNSSRLNTLNMSIPLSKKNMFHVERNSSDKRISSDIQIPINEVKNIEIKKEEFVNVSDLNTKIMQNIEIKKENETDESKIRDIKLDSILNKGELLLNIINSKKLENEGIQKINSLQDIIEVRKKEIELAKINLEKIMSYNQKLKSYNKEEFEEIINKIKDNYKEYKNKIEILKLFGKILNKPEIDEDAKSLMINYKTIYSKCQALLNKILSGLSRVLKECLNLEEFVKILSNNGDIDKSKMDFVLNSGDIDKNIEYLRNMFKNELNGVLTNFNITIEDNMLSATNSESNINLNSSPNNNINLSSENISIPIDVNKQTNNNEMKNIVINNNETKNIEVRKFFEISNNASNNNKINNNEAKKIFEVNNNAPNNNKVNNNEVKKIFEVNNNGINNNKINNNEVKKIFEVNNKEVNTNNVNNNNININNVNNNEAGNKEVNNKEINKEINNEVNKEVNKEINNEVIKEVNKEVNKEMNKEMNKEVNNEVNNDINDEITNIISTVLDKAMNSTDNNINEIISDMNALSNDSINNEMNIVPKID